MRKINAIIASLTLAGLGQVVPQDSIAAVECADRVCEVVFENTDSVQSFNVPDGLAELEFEVYGAQGGSGGGLGGYVSGVLTDLPETITVMVGGAGNTGDRVAGGFNGGGVAGGAVGSPGSGGGASDLRFGNNLQDRVVVAGGGGGRGGPLGGYGASGGGEVAADGSSGQGVGGEGGSQSNGGAGGRTNSSGGIDGMNGQLGIGGDGGYDSGGYAGGAGGGGYYGGGGGGADTDSCCTDAGGGGGGSSYANSTYASSVSFEPGSRQGDGLVVLRYQKPVEITEFSYQQLTPVSALVTLSFDEEIASVNLADFSITGCEVASLTSEGERHLLSLDECNSSPTVEIESGTMGENQNLPTTNQILELQLDQVAPALQLTAPGSTSESSFEVEIVTDESGIFDFQNISIPDCDFVSVADGPIAILTLSDCPEGEILITLPQSFLSDEIGNETLATPSEITVLIDQTAPSLSFQETSFAQTEQPDQEIISTTPVVFEEVSATFEQFVFQGDEACRVSAGESEQGITLITQGCPSGEVSWTMPAQSMQDSVGNQGPLEAVVARFSIPEIEINEPQPEPEQTPSPEQNPDPEPVTDSEPTPVPETTPAPETTQPTPQIDPVPVIIPEPSPEPETETELEPEPETEPETSEESEEQIFTDSELPPEPLIAEESEGNSGSEDQGLGDQEQDETSGAEVTEVPRDPAPEVVENRPPPETLAIGGEQNNQASVGSDQEPVNPWAIAIAALLVLGLLVAVLVLTKNNRPRAID